MKEGEEDATSDEWGRAGGAFLILFLRRFFFLLDPLLVSLFPLNSDTRTLRPLLQPSTSLSLPKKHVPPRLSGRHGPCSRGPELVALLFDPRLGFPFFGARLGVVVVLGADEPGLGPLVLAAPALVRLRRSRGGRRSAAQGSARLGPDPRRRAAREQGKERENDGGRRERKRSSVEMSLSPPFALAFFFQSSSSSPLRLLLSSLFSSLSLSTSGL